MTMARMKRHSTSDSMDDWLDSQGFYRKHVAKDGSCLFRAVAEQVFDAQVFHTNVRECCVKYLDRNRELFDEFIDGPFDTHLENMKNPNEFAGQVEMSALSLLLKRDILVFHEVGRQAFNVTDNGFENKVMLYLSQGNHYDSVFHKNEIADAAMSQSLIYEILYKRVFRMGDEVDLAVEKMLHDKAYAKMRKDSTASMDSNWCPELQDGSMQTPDFGLDQENEDDEDQSKDPASEIRRALAQGYPPFPYKVAKALDPQIYRNVEFDVWNEAQKDLTIFEPGVKCLVRLDKEKQESYHAHIQEMSQDKGPVTVYIVELGKKQTVPYDSLEPLPAYNKSWQTFGAKSYKTVSTYYHKPHVSNGILDLDKFKGKKRMYKKGKYKDVTFSMPLPCGGQGPPPPPRAHHPQSQFDSSIFTLGRGRGRIPYQSIPRNPSPHMKWISPIHSNSQRYRQKSGGSGRYYSSNMGLGQDSQVRMYDHRSNYDNQQREQHHQREPAPLLSCGSVPPVPWSKGGSRNSFQQRGSLGCHTQSGSDMDRNFSKLTRTNVESEASPTHENAVSGCPASSGNSVAVSAPMLSMGMPTYTSTSSCNQGSIISIPPSSQNGVAPSSIPQSPTATNAPIASDQSPTVKPLMASTPTHHQLTLYPCHYYSGVYVPYEHPQLPVNFSVMRSQDPGGADLPLQDLSTLRFFFNLGCDYFRMSTVVQVPPNSNQYGMWNYGSGQGYSQPFNGYLTPMSSSDCYETADDSASASCSTGSTTAGLSPVDDLAAAQLPDEVYEAPTYIYSSSPVNFVPAIYHPSLDYCAAPPMAGMLGDFKNGLVLNDQGMLSLGTPPPPLGSYCNTPPSGHHQQDSRHRSDSASSNLSQHSVSQDWSRPVAAAHHGHEHQHGGHHDTRYYADGSYVEHNNGNGGGRHSSSNGGTNAYPSNGSGAVYRGNGNGNGGVIAVNPADCNGVISSSNNGNYSEGAQNGDHSGYPGNTNNGGCGSYPALGSGCVPGCYPGNSHRHSSTRIGVATGGIPPRFQHQRRNVSPNKQSSSSASPYHHQHSSQYGGARPTSMVSTAAYPLVPTGTPVVATSPPQLNGGGAYPVAGSASHPTVMTSSPNASYYQHHPSAVLYPTTTHSQQQQQPPYFPASS